MNKYSVLAMATLAISAGSAFAEESAFKVDTNIGAFSHYVFRGAVLDEELNAQGNITVSHESGFFADAWMLHSLSEDSDITGEAELNEVDLTFGYASTYNNIDYSAGLITYTYPDGTDADYEFFTTAALNNLIVTPYAEVYADMKNVTSLYAKLGLEKDIDVSEAMTLTAGASIGMASKDYCSAATDTDKESDTLWDAVLYANAAYALSEKSALNFSVMYSALADGGVDDYADKNAIADDAVVGGISFSHSF